MTLNPLHLTHLKRCMNILSVAVLNVEQPGVSRFRQQPDVLQQALLRLQQGVDETAGVTAVEGWQPESKLVDEVVTTGSIDTSQEVSTQVDEGISVTESDPPVEELPEPEVVAALAPSDATPNFEAYPAELVEIEPSAHLSVKPEQGGVTDDGSVPTQQPVTRQTSGSSLTQWRNQQARGFFQAMPWGGYQSQEVLVSRLRTDSIADTKAHADIAELPLARAFFQAMPWSAPLLPGADREGFSIRPGSQVSQLHLHREIPGINPVLAATASALSTSRQTASLGGATAGEFFRQIPWTRQVAAAAGS